MKIDSMSQNQAYVPQTIGKTEDKGQQAVFDSMMEEKTPEVKMKEESIPYDMIESLDKLKEKLDFELTVENLRDYKEAVKKFLDHYTKNELQLESRYLTDRRGYTKKMYMIQTINEKMSELTERMLETHQGHFETLKKIGDIQGMLVDLYL